MKTIAEIHVANLDELAKPFGSQRQFAIHLNKDPKQVNQWWGKGSARGIGPALARELEAHFGKPRGWLDNDHSAASQPVGLDLDILRTALIALREAAEAEEKEIDLYDSAPIIAYAYRERASMPGTPTKAQLREFDESIRLKLRGDDDGGWTGPPAGTGK